MFGKTKILVLIAILFSFTFSLAFVHASYCGSPCLHVPDVGPNQPINGYLNASFSNEDSSNIIEGKITDSDGNSIEDSSMTLFDFLKSSQASFSCDPRCQLDYETTGSNIKGSTLNRGNHTIGFEVHGQVTDLRFTFSTSGSSSLCGVTPLTIDLFNDNTIDYQYLGQPDIMYNMCDKAYSSCYDDQASTQDVVIDSRLCQIVTIDKTSKVMLGAKIKLVDSGQEINDNDLIMEISDGTQTKRCGLAATYSQDYSEVGCSNGDGVEFIVTKPENVTICIMPNGTSNSGKYYIKSEAERPMCGTVNDQNANSDFALFAQPYKIPQSITYEVFNSTFYHKQTGSNLISDINSYIQQKYNGNCTDGCIIPIKIQTNSNFTINKFNANYKSGELTVTVRDVYKLQTSYPIVNASGIIPLNAFNMTAPSEIGSYTFEAYYQGPLDSADFDVKPVPIIVTLYPQQVTVGEETNFYAYAYSPKGNNITSYNVNFGDGSSASSTDGRISHTYSTQGNYTLTVSVTDSQNLTGIKQFIIQAGIFVENLNQSIISKGNSIESFIESLTDPLLSQLVESKLHVNETNNALIRLYQGLNNGSLTASQVKQQLSQLQIPTQIVTSEEVSSFRSTPDYNNIRSDIIESVISVKPDCNNEEACKKAAAKWTLDNTNIMLSSRSYSVVFDDGSSVDLGTSLNIDITKSTDEESSIIIQTPAATSSLVFSDNNFNVIGNAFVFNITTNHVYIEVVMPKVDAMGLTVYALPLSLDVTGFGNYQVKKPQKTSSAPLIIGIILIVVVIAGVIVIWIPYFKKKKKLLFPNTYDLRNITMFIVNSINAGYPINEIKKKLLAAGWKNEQIGYAMKKVLKEKPQMKKKLHSNAKLLGKKKR